MRSRQLLSLDGTLYDNALYRGVPQAAGASSVCRDEDVPVGPVFGVLASPLHILHPPTPQPIKLLPAPDDA